MIDGRVVPVILGPTCSWKSEVACRLAELLGADIVSCDSMQVYKGLEIGTAQPSVQMRARVPHHLVGCMDIAERYDAGRFVEMANATIRCLAERGRRVVLVGGTGLYARALVYGLDLLPGDQAISMALRPLLETDDGRQSLWNEMLTAVSSLDEIPRDVWLNPRRWLRACEVLRITGKLPWQFRQKNNEPRKDFMQFCIIPDFTMLKDRIRERTVDMLRRGWVQEAVCASRNGLMDSPTARQALGYRDILEFVDSHMIPLDEAQEAELAVLLANRTIQYARRQMTWFKHQHPGAVMIPVDSSDNACETILKRVVGAIEAM